MAWIAWAGGVRVRVVVWAAIAGAAAGGCTSVNKRLNDPRLPVERRAHNQTRAATGIAVTPAAARDPLRLRAESLRAESTTWEGEGAELAVADRNGNHAGDAGGAAGDVHPDGCFVGLALSGGGSRSANFSAACMFQLQRLGVLEHVDYISSVSGGSLTAAYYCLHADGPGGWNPGRVQKKLTHAFASDLIFNTFVPWNAVALFFTDWDRSDVLADSFTKNLFSRKGKPLTFGDLRPDRPRLLINATDLQSGRRFVFCNESFDELNSDLSKYPLANAVAASAAVPVLMHHVTLRDFSTTFKQYRHLIDGGVVDNLGVQSLIETYAAQTKCAVDAGLPDPYPRGAVLIVLDARTEFDARLSDKGDISFFSSLTTGAGLTSTILLNRVSTATLADLIVRNADDDTTAKELREAIGTLEEGGSLTLRTKGDKPVRVLHLALSRVEDLSTLPSRGFREQVNSIATYFNIGSGEAHNLYQAAELLVRERFEGELVALKQQIEGESGPLAAPATAPVAPPAPAASVKAPAQVRETPVDP
jgi:predicted acylesterase/phospholipase RssA